MKLTLELSQTSGFLGRKKAKTDNRNGKEEEINFREPKENEQADVLSLLEAVTPEDKKEHSFSFFKSPPTLTSLSRKIGAEILSGDSVQKPLLNKDKNRPRKNKTGSGEKKEAGFSVLRSSRPRSPKLKRRRARNNNQQNRKGRGNKSKSLENVISQSGKCKEDRRDAVNGLQKRNSWKSTSKNEEGGHTITGNEYKSTQTLVQPNLPGARVEQGSEASSPLPVMGDYTKTSALIRNPAARKTPPQCKKPVETGGCVASMEEGVGQRLKKGTNAKGVVGQFGNKKSVEKKNQLQGVVSELKARTRVKGLRRNTERDPQSTLKSGMDEVKVIEEQNNHDEMPRVEKGVVTSGASDAGNALSIKAWFGKNGKPNKGGQNQRREGKWRKSVLENVGEEELSQSRRFMKFDRGQKNEGGNQTGTDGVQTRRFGWFERDAQNGVAEDATFSRRMLWFDKDDVGAGGRKGGRLVLPFKMFNNGLTRSRSVGYMEYDGIEKRASKTDEEMNGMKELLRTIAMCEQRLAEFQVETQKNMKLFEGHLMKLHEMLRETMRVHDLRYHAAVSDLKDNQTTLLQVENGFNYLWAEMSRTKRTVLTDRLDRAWRYVWEQVFSSVLTLTQMTTSLYCKLRPRRNGNM